MAQQKSVTLVISHVLDPEHGQQYEAWLGKIMPIAAEFPGHLGANVIRPAPGQNLWSVIIRFDTIEHLYALDPVGDPPPACGGNCAAAERRRSYRSPD